MTPYKPSNFSYRTFCGSINLSIHQAHMHRAIALARQGMGRVSPNPLVGAVIVDAEGNVRAEGYHAYHGAVHAEIDALNHYARQFGTRHMPPGTTLYCNLEPCSHQGKGKINAPCAPQIIAAGFSRVVVGMQDPNPRVQGNGIAQLQAAGIDVITEICHAEAQHLNRIFRTHILHQRPHILLKMAQTLDGRIASLSGDSQWVTNARARARGHALRAQYDAVMVGSGTAIHDNPRLNVRLVEGRDPIRILIDGALKTPASHHLFQDELAAQTRVYTAPGTLRNHSHLASYTHRGAQLIPLPLNTQGRLPLDQVMAHLYQQGVYSVMVEGGAGLITALLQHKLADSAHIAIAPKILGTGIAAIGDLHCVTMAEALPLYDVTYTQVDQQMICEGHFQPCLPD